MSKAAAKNVFKGDSPALPGVETTKIGDPAVVPLPPPVDNADKPALVGLPRFPAGTKFYYMDAEKVEGVHKTLHPTKVIGHKAEMDKPGSAVFGPISKKYVLEWEKRASEIGGFKFNEKAVRDALRDHPVLSAGLTVVDLFNPSWGNGQSVEATRDDVDYIKRQGSKNPALQKILIEADSFKDLPDEAKLSSIYNLVQRRIRQNQAEAGSLSLSDALEKGVGVCRHCAIVLAAALDRAGFGTDVINKGDHAWTRVTTKDGRKFDLDSNGYYSYIELPPRAIDEKLQLVPYSKR